MIWLDDFLKRCDYSTPKNPLCLALLFVQIDLHFCIQAQPPTKLLRWLEVIFAKSSSKRGRMVEKVKWTEGGCKNHLLALCVTIIGKFLAGKCPPFTTDELLMQLQVNNGQNFVTVCCRHTSQMGREIINAWHLRFKCFKRRRYQSKYFSKIMSERSELCYWFASLAPLVKSEFLGRFRSRLVFECMFILS